MPQPGRCTTCFLSCFISFRPLVEPLSSRHSTTEPLVECVRAARSLVIDPCCSRMCIRHTNQVPLKPMTQLRCAAFLFDLDGVLIDSTPAVERVWRGWAIERGFDPDQVVASAHGRPSLTTVRE